MHSKTVKPEFRTSDDPRTWMLTIWKNDPDRDHTRKGNKALKLSVKAKKISRGPGQMLRELELDE